MSVVLNIFIKKRLITKSSELSFLHVWLCGRLQFVCDQKELHVVKKALDESGLESTAARLEFIPHTFSLLEDAGLEAAASMREALLELDEAVRVFDNIGPAKPTT